MDPCYITSWYLTPPPTGGIAGVGAKVTGVFGDVVAKLTFDEDFMKQRKRQQTSFGQGIESFSKVHAPSPCRVGVDMT